MDYYPITGLAITGIVATIGFLKIEMIKEIAKKLTSDKEKIRPLSIFLIIIFAALLGIIPVLFAQSSGESNQVGADINSKSDAEVKADFAKDVIDKGIDKGEEWAKNSKEKKEKQRKELARQDSIFKANRPQRWVYQIGDLMNSDEAILRLCQELNDPEDICLFKDKSNYLLFVENQSTKKELEDSLENFRMKISGSKDIRIKIIDLMSYCNNSEEEIIKTEPKKFGRRKEKIKLDCFVISKT